MISTKRPQSSNARSYAEYIVSILSSFLDGVLIYQPWPMANFALPNTLTPEKAERINVSHYKVFGSSADFETFLLFGLKVSSTEMYLTDFIPLYSEVSTCLKVLNLLSSENFHYFALAQSIP